MQQASEPKNLQWFKISETIRWH